MTSTDNYGVDVPEGYSVKTEPTGSLGDLNYQLFAPDGTLLKTVNGEVFEFIWKKRLERAAQSHVNETRPTLSAIESAPAVVSAEAERPTVGHNL